MPIDPTLIDLLAQPPATNSEIHKNSFRFSTNGERDGRDVIDTSHFRQSAFDGPTLRISSEFNVAS